MRKPQHNQITDNLNGEELYNWRSLELSWMILQNLKKSYWQSDRLKFQDSYITAKLPRRRSKVSVDTL